MSTLVRQPGFLPWAFGRLRVEMKHLLLRALRPLAAIAGFDLMLRHYYSPIPDIALVPETLWETPSTLSGIDFDVEAQIGFAERELARYLNEFDPPRERRSSSDAFYLRNSTYESVDAEVLYAMIRHLKPRRIIELGSGSSSLVIAEARRRNTADGHHSSYSIFDPFPRFDLRPALEDAGELAPVAATDIPLDTFRALERGDLLFVDTTHTVKVGGDVNYIVLDVLPTLQPGVVVHFHDIFWPYEYPRELAQVDRYFWAEQYLLQAFLAFNRDFEVLFGAHAVARGLPGRLRSLIPSFSDGVRPGALWIRRTCAS